MTNYPQVFSAFSYQPVNIGSKAIDAQPFTTILGKFVAAWAIGYLALNDDRVLFASDQQVQTTTRTQRVLILDFRLLSMNLRGRFRISGDKKKEMSEYCPILQ